MLHEQSWKQNEQVVCLEMFLEESPFCLQKKMEVWLKLTKMHLNKQNQHKISAEVPIMRHGGGDVMIWGCFAATGSSYLAATLVEMCFEAISCTGQIFSSTVWELLLKIDRPATESLGYLVLLTFFLLCLYCLIFVSTEHNNGNLHVSVLALASTHIQLQHM